METLMGILLVVGALLTIIGESRTLLQKAGIALSAGALLFMLLPGFAESDPQLKIALILGAMLLVGMLLAFTKFGLAPWLAGAATLLIFTLSGEKATYFGFELNFSGILLVLPLLGAAGPLILPWKARFLEKWTGANAVKMTGAGLTFYAGLLAFFAVFQAGFFGLSLVATGWLAVALADKTNRLENGAFALLSLGFVAVLLKTNTHVDAALLRGNFFMGLLAGTGAIAWINAVKDAHAFRWPLMYLVPSAVAIGCVMMGIANENFGGIPSYAGVLIGSALGLIARSKFTPAIALMTLLLAVSPIVVQQFKPVELPKKTSRLDATKPAEIAAKKPSVLDVNAITLTNTLAGSWKSDLEASKVDFELGPEESRTKGAISEFDVRLKLSAEGLPEQLTVQIPTAKVTTLNPMRDESVLGPGYIDAAKFPKTGFTATSFKKEGDVFVANGTFEFRGKSQPLTVKLKFAATGNDKGKDYLVMVGETSFDRTKFGMRSDPKIGNLVDVTFEIEFRK